MTPREPVEMSAYIEIEDYDHYEIKHAYYIEMMEAMLGEFSASRPVRGDGQPDVSRALELGAGTGIFTRRLDAQPRLEITAVEIDAVCQQKLARNLHHIPGVTPVLADSRTFGADGPPAQFGFAFSSFADHHIHPEDRDRYLRNVRRHLAAEGVFIVGDEFLPPHAEHDPGARSAALHAYHGHIIDCAHAWAGESERAGDLDEAKCHRELAKLEGAALESGLAKQGDFKMTTQV